MFFSPDPFVQAPDNWVNYNRYGYCMNNPLIYNDPSGYKLREANDNYRYDPALAIDNGNFSPSFGQGGYLSELRDGAWNGGGGPMRYFYSSGNGNYYNEHGNQVSFNEVYNNYLLPNEALYQSSFDKRLGKYGHTKEGSKIENFGGVNGLTITEYEGYDDGQGLNISLTYTGPGLDGAYWAQFLITNYPDPKQFDHFIGTKTYWDDYYTGNGRYYTNDELHDMSTDGSIKFGDGAHRPYSDTPWFFSAKLYLFNSQNEVILNIYYSFSVNGHNVTANPITAIIP